MVKLFTTLEPQDVAAIEGLNDFLPDRLFDAHAHIFSPSFQPTNIMSDKDAVCDAECYFKGMRAMVCNRELSANFITKPDPAMRDIALGHLYASDDFLFRELDKNQDCVGEIMILPSESDGDIEARLVHKSIRGIKCYGYMAESKTPGKEALCEFLPESAIALADRRGLAITIHLMRAGLADRENAEYIIDMAKKYPNAKFILAHSARAFAAHTLIDNIDKVKPYENIFFDFSAICESPTFTALLLKVGSGRCMWGTDYPNSVLRGKAISYADGFTWLFDDKLDGAWLYGIEGLYAVKEAATILSLKNTQIEDIFYNTAKSVFNL